MSCKRHWLFTSEGKKPSVLGSRGVEVVAMSQHAGVIYITPDENKPARIGFSCNKEGAGEHSKMNLFLGLTNFAPILCDLEVTHILQI